jgi:ribonucleotide monophosphatase NagD (HAD superfamily)
MPEGLSLGIGPFVRALEVSSGVEAELMGKPTKRFFELAIARLKELHGVGDGQLAMENIAVIGDDIVNDLGQGAKDLGLQRILGE